MSDALHAYLILDTSASMSGAPLEALKQGVHLLWNALSARWGRTTLISVIAYESAAKEIIPLTDVQAGLHLPPLEAAGSSALGGAFRLLASRLTGHHPTLVYLFTDGDPTDDWEKAAALVRSRVDKIVGIACGLTVKEALFDAIANESYSLSHLTTEALTTTFTRL